MFPSDIPRKTVRGFCALCVCLALCVSSRAQTPLGALRGTVQDSSGGRVVSAVVSVANPEQSYAKETQTDARGEFRFEDLPPGEYALGVSATGFAEARSRVNVALSAERQVSVTLQPKGVAEKVV